MPSSRRRDSTANMPTPARPRTRRRKPRYKLFHRVVELLHEALPAKHPVDVQLGWVNNYNLGECSRRGSHFRIRVSSRQPEWFAIETLVHEWAHALSWDAYKNVPYWPWAPAAEYQSPVHGDAWGRAYSKVYRAVFFDIIPQIRKEQRAARRLKQKGRTR
jgi:hypothetical protein